MPRFPYPSLISKISQSMMRMGSSSTVCLALDAGRLKTFPAFRVKKKKLTEENVFQHVLPGIRMARHLLSKKTLEDKEVARRLLEKVFEDFALLYRDQA